jgi:small subunit ribosomal protein S6
MADEDIVGFTERFSTLIKTSGGEIIKIEDWGSKKLAYLVKKRDKGRFVLFDFVGLPALIAEMERQYKISEEVIKFLSVKLDEDVDLEAFKAAQEKPAEPEAATEVPPAEALPDTTETAVPETPEPEAVSEIAAVEQEAAPEVPVPEEPSLEQEAAPEAPAPEEPSLEQEAVPVVESTESEPVQPQVEASAEPVAIEEPTPSEPVAEDKKEEV